MALRSKSFPKEGVRNGNGKNMDLGLAVQAAPIRRARVGSSDATPDPADGAAVSAEAHAEPSTEARPATASYSASLTKTPLGFGMDLSEDKVVSAVKAGSQAARVGIAVGDKVVTVNDKPLAADEKLSEVISGFAVGAEVTFGLLSNAGDTEGDDDAHDAYDAYDGYAEMKT